MIGRLICDGYLCFRNIVLMKGLNRLFPAIMMHSVFWIGIWFLYFYFFNYNSSDRGYVVWFSSLLLPLTMAVTYFAVYFLIPRYLYRKDYRRFILFTFYTLLASAYFIVLIIYGVLIFYKRFDASEIPPMVKNFFFILILVYLVVGLVSFITILNRNFDIEKRNKDLSNKMLAAQLQLKEQELYYLKRQIHPHFLFNTLNTLYGLALKQSADTPETILKLSNLLDYILYQVDKLKVPLKEEVMHIREYVELERIRYQESLQVEFHAHQLDERMEIAPMILIPFVENAFKHGSLKDGRLTVQIRMEANENLIFFQVKNTSAPPDPAISSNGLGLENLRKRLEMNYPGNSRVEYGYSEGWFTAALTLKKNSPSDEAQDN